MAARNPRYLPPSCKRRCAAHHFFCAAPILARASGLRTRFGRAITEQVYAELDAGATAAGLSIPHYIRTRCGFQVRNTSLPGTEERDREEDDAWERLRRLGFEPEEYFTRQE